MFRINWTSRLTGATGHGEPVFTEAVALGQIAKLNTAWPDFIHSVEKIETLSPLNVKGHRCSYGDLTFVANMSPTPSQTSTPNAYVTPKPSASSQTLGQPLAQPLAQPSSVASLPSQEAQVSQQQSSPPPSGFSTSFF
jgi:hypothetical protein